MLVRETEGSQGSYTQGHNSTSSLHVSDSERTGKSSTSRDLKYPLCGGIVTKIKKKPALQDPG